MTWCESSPRFDDLLVPVLRELRDDSPAVIHGLPNVVPLLPPDVPHIAWEQAVGCDSGLWRAEYGRCWPQWKQRLQTLCNRLELPRGAFELLAQNLLISSQDVVGCLELLERVRPRAVVTEYDRNARWSRLILAARRLGIPTATLVHGTINREAVGFSPVLADRIIVWGELDRDKLVAAGEAPEKVVVGGCPKLSRDLTTSSPEGKARLALDPRLPVVMFATGPEQVCLGLAESFCGVVESLGSVSGVVRLHSSENPARYAKIARRHPLIRFVANSEFSLDESLAATDVVVVRVSGLGSDALVKRRPVIVFNPEPTFPGHDWDLVEHAGCPVARTSDELSNILRQLLHDEDFHRKAVNQAEAYVARFCASFGQEAARSTAEIVREMTRRPDNG